MENPIHRCDAKANSKILEKRVEQSDAKAQLQLGKMYRSGDKVLQNNQKASYYFEKAVSQEHRLAQYKLSKIDDGHISKILDSLEKL